MRRVAPVGAQMDQLPHLIESIHRADTGARPWGGASLEGVAKCRTAAFVVSGEGHLLHANSEGEKLLQDGSAIRVRHGKISTWRTTDADQLLALIRAASLMGADAAQHDGVMLVPRRKGIAVGVLVAPFRTSIPGHPPAGAIVFVRDPAKVSLDRSTLQRLYGLTPAEARIADALARGNSIEEIAAEQGIGCETVRKQVKGVLSKTGTHRQAQCVAMMLRGVASMNCV